MNYRKLYASLKEPSKDKIENYFQNSKIVLDDFSHYLSKNIDYIISHLNLDLDHSFSLRFLINEVDLSNLIPDTKRHVKNSESTITIQSFCSKTDGYNTFIGIFGEPNDYKNFLIRTSQRKKDDYTGKMCEINWFLSNQRISTNTKLPVSSAQIIPNGKDLIFKSEFTYENQFYCQTNNYIFLGELECLSNSQTFFVYASIDKDKNVKISNTESKHNSKKSLSYN